MRTIYVVVDAATRDPIFDEENGCLFAFSKLEEAQKVAFSGETIEEWEVGELTDGD